MPTALARLVYFAGKSRRGDLEHRRSHGFWNLSKQNRTRISRLSGLRVIKTNARDARIDVSNAMTVAVTRHSEAWYTSI